MEVPAEPADVRNEMLDICNAVVSVYKARLGRGPTRTRAAYAGPDTIVCTLEDSLVPIEATLIAAGQPDRARDVRHWFQSAGGRDEIVSAVERITGRAIRGHVSGTDIENDISTEVFYLRPAAPSAA